MSADNGVYILQTKDGFRVIHAQAIDNISYNADATGFNLRILYQYFCDSQCYKNKKQATDRAVELYEEIMNDDFCPVCEYGISFINAKDITFPKECPPCCANPSIMSISGDLIDGERNQCSNCGEYLE